MNEMATVSRDTLWAVLPLLKTRIKEIRETMGLCGEEHKEFYDFCENLLKECIIAYNEISSALGLGGISSVVEKLNETEV